MCNKRIFLLLWSFCINHCKIALKFSAVISQVSIKLLCYYFYSFDIYKEHCTKCYRTTRVSASIRLQATRLVCHATWSVLGTRLKTVEMLTSSVCTEKVQIVETVNYSSRYHIFALSSVKIIFTPFSHLYSLHRNMVRVLNRNSRK